MKRMMVGVPALLLAGGVLLAQEHGGRIDWVRDPAVGFAKMKLESRAGMLYFTASW